jgi:hypothetical protein
MAVLVGRAPEGSPSHDLPVLRPFQARVLEESTALQMPAEPHGERETGGALPGDPVGFDRIGRVPR